MTTDPKWTRLQSASLVVAGHEFIPYRADVATFLLHCDAINATIGSFTFRGGYHASVQGKQIKSEAGTGERRTKVFRSRENAIKAAIKEAARRA